jgi:hypothetical protein
MPFEPHDSYVGWEFQVPDNPSHPIRTLADLRRMAGENSGSTRTLFWTQPSNNLESYTDTNLGFAQPGQDVTIHVVFGTNRGAEFFRHSLGVVLDYEPVEFKYERLNDDRSEVIDSGVSHGLYGRLQGGWVAYDITIPATSFTDGRYHEIGIFSSISDGDFPAGRTAVSTRHSVLYAGANFPEVPDPVCHLGEPYDDIERTQAVESASRSLLLLEGDRFADPLPDEPVEASPGEQIELRVTLAERESPEDGEFRLVAIPLLNGKPLADTIWYQDVLVEDQNDKDVSYRNRLRVTMPEEPGEYVVRVAAWRHPFQPVFQVTGAEIPKVFRGNAGLHTNNLVFHVVDPKLPASD